MKTAVTAARAMIRVVPRAVAAIIPRMEITAGTDLRTMTTARVEMDIVTGGDRSLTRTDRLIHGRLLHPQYW